MNQAEVTKLVSKLRFTIQPKARKLKNKDGPEGRLGKLRKTVTALIKHERIELNYPRADEARGYTERVIKYYYFKYTNIFNLKFLQLISDAIRYGDKHRTTMEMADFWLQEKQLVHKLFKVLAPRYENYDVSYTRMYKAPKTYPGPVLPKAVLELRGNPYPSLITNTHSNRNLIHNVLLDEAKKDYRAKKYAEIAQKVAAGEKEASAEKESSQVETASTSNPTTTTSINEATSAAAPTVT